MLADPRGHLVVDRDGASSQDHGNTLEFGGVGVGPAIGVPVPAHQVQFHVPFDRPVNA